MTIYQIQVLASTFWMNCKDDEGLPLELFSKSNAETVTRLLSFKSGLPLEKYYRLVDSHGTYHKVEDD